MPKIDRGRMETRRARESSLPGDGVVHPENSIQNPIPSEIPLEAPFGVTSQQYAHLLQQMQGLAAAVQNLHQLVTQKVPPIPAPIAPEQPRRSPSPIPPAPRNSERNLRPEAPCYTISNSTAESSYFPKTTHSNDPKEYQLIKRVEEMGRQLKALKVKSSQPFERDFTTDPPFSAKVMNEPIPLRFKMPQTELYDGTSDPLDHLESFKSLMLLHGANNGVMCRAFPATLRKLARLWFLGLHAGSINSFE